jgi:hypothetical protein
MTDTTTAQQVTGFMRPCEMCSGKGTIYYGGFCLPCGDCDGTGICPEPDLDDTQKIDVDAVLAHSAPCVDPQVEMQDTLRWLEAQQPEPELPLLMQAVSGFLSLLAWDIETRTPIDRLSDDQREILARVSQMVESELGDSTKNAD